MPNGFTVFLGIAEVAGGLGIALGVFTQVAAFGLIAVMLGAIEKKIRSWHTGFWGEKAYGWHYDLIFILINLVIASIDGGRYVLLKVAFAAVLPFALHRPNRAFTLGSKG